MFGNPTSSSGMKRIFKIGINYKLNKYKPQNYVLWLQLAEFIFIYFVILKGKDSASCHQ